MSIHPSNESWLNLLLGHLTDFVLIFIDRDGRFISWHPGVEQQFGYTAGEFIGQSGELLLTLPDRLQGAFRRELRVATETGRASDTTWLVTKSGKPVFVEGVTLALRDPASGELLGFGKILHDITERKQTEDDLTALTQMLDQSVVYICNWDGLVEHWTAGSERLYGYSHSEALGKLADELLRTRYPGSKEAVHGELLQQKAWRGELQQKRRDGATVSVSAHWILRQDSAGRPSIIATHSDITSLFTVQQELGAVNQRLKSMALELERSNAELEEFARIASHDLSAPITSTRWLVELLTTRHGGSLNSEGQSFLKQIMLGLQRMTDLVEAILKHAQVGTNAINASEPASADAALNIAIENLQRDLATSGATLTRAPLPHLFIGAQFLTQLFQNLLSNSIKYRRKDLVPHIDISAEHKHGAWVIGVKDNGIGIEPEWFERIFQPMQRLHGADVAGSGIGLATCRKIVSRAGGDIWLESELGSGSTFFFSLPGPRP